MTRPSSAPSLGALLQEYFCQRLIAQRDVSPDTVASYRDTFRLLLGYVQNTTANHPQPSPSKTLTPPWCSRFSSTLSATEATHRAHATHGWPQFAHFCTLQR